MFPAGSSTGDKSPWFEGGEDDGGEAQRPPRRGGGETVWKRGDIDELMPLAPEFTGGRGNRVGVGGGSAAEVSSDDLLAAYESNNNGGSSDDGGSRGDRHRSSASARLTAESTPSPEQRISWRRGSPSSPAGERRKKRASSAEGVPRIAGSGGGDDRGGKSPIPRRGRGRGRREPPTPRSTERALSPFLVPPPQQPPPCLTPPPNLAAARSSSGAPSGARTGADADEETRGRSGDASKSSGSERLPVGVYDGIDKGDGSAAAFAVMMDAAPEDRMRRNMLQAQSIRDRYLRWVSYFLRPRHRAKETWRVTTCITCVSLGKCHKSIAFRHRQRQLPPCLFDWGVDKFLGVLQMILIVLQLQAKSQG